MSRRLLLCSSVLVLAGLLPGTASAVPAPERGLLVIEGQGGRTGVLDVPRRIQLADPRPELTGGRSFAGFLVEPMNPEPARVRQFGAVAVRAFRDDTSSAVGMISFESELAPGRYRVTLLGDGPVRVSLPMADRNAEGLTLVPRTLIRTQFLGRAEALPMGRATARVDLPRTLAAGRRAIQVTLFAREHVSQLRMCATTEPQCPQTPPEPLPVAGSAAGPQILPRLVEAAPQVRALRWWTDGVRLEDDRLRIAAIVF